MHAYLGKQAEIAGQGGRCQGESMVRRVLPSSAVAAQLELLPISPRSIEHLEGRKE